MNWSIELQNKIIDYYRKYYNSCGLRNVEEFALKRLNEEELEVKRMKRLEQVLNMKFDSTQKHFVFGAGTGGLAVALHQNFDCDVFGIEPNEQAFEIIQGKAREKGVNPAHFKKEFGENLSFSDNLFDVTHCFTVLEHVKDIEKCIKEMLRATKPEGIVYISAPNYTYPEERHYKLFFPTFLPRFLGLFYLFLLRKPLKLIKSINFITEKNLDKILNNQKNITWYRIREPLKREQGGIKSKLLNFYKFNLLVEPMQNIIIKKHA